MQQLSLPDGPSPARRRATRRERFLAQMDRLVPWERLVEWVEPHYPRAGRPGGRPIGAGRLLRMHFLQRWYGLTDAAMEDALHDSRAMRAFVGVDLDRDTVPDATTLQRFRARLATRGLTPALVRTVDAALASAGVRLRRDPSGELSLVPRRALPLAS